MERPIEAFPKYRAERLASYGAFFMRKKGVVKFFRKDRGFGFIVPSDGGSDVFVHYTDIDSDEAFRTLLDGQNVEYDESPGDRGPKAKNVRVVPLE